MNVFENFIYYFIKLFTYAMILISFGNFFSLLNQNILSLVNNNCTNYYFKFSYLISFKNSFEDLIKKDMYIFPELKNIICLGKLSKYSDLDLIVFTNPKLVFYLTLFNFIILIISKFVIKPNKYEPNNYFFLINFLIYINFFISFSIFEKTILLVTTTFVYVYVRESFET